ncbi:hypothetical protein EV193_11691 [Herbihabitans rhizosphaerae]|uniref:Uncharacterized protein n=1 Tax=Herbihabitans rhizosphaerae TaxID=1872711 RepID=A0A4Q7KET8_9PSEU|nr:hypothetical protein [Herbihabitans rhizosphaerae]RZS30570.1 hypothetical protein EV193_11691 [Herbihabitans rhizosphaerae]
MSVHLAFGVVAGPELGCWLPGDPPRRAEERTGAHPPGAPVAVGPADAAPDAVLAATKQLTALVADGDVAAGAGVDLGGGFGSARLAGARGDRRDAVLAAMRVLGADGAHRLGDRTGTLVALFGPSATKPVGAAARTAIAEERWAALQLASAASDLLGPEQVERVLALRAPEEVDPFPHGAASTVAEHLSPVLTRYPRPRRLALITGLWEQVCAERTSRLRAARLPGTQVRIERIDKLRERFSAHFDAPILQRIAWDLGENPTIGAAARWRPPADWTANELRRLLNDAIGATALLRFAKAVSDLGLETAAKIHYAELHAANECLSKEARNVAARRDKGAYSHPARPGCYVHDLVQMLRPGRTVSTKAEVQVKQRIGMARNYGVVVFDAITKIVDDELYDVRLRGCWDACTPWETPTLHSWRTTAGFSRPARTWENPPLADANEHGPTRTLAQRLADAPDEQPADVERPHDLLWLADLADALAPFYGNESATVLYERHSPSIDYREPRPPPETRRPRADSVPLAAAGVAQLVAFGATPPPRGKTWTELLDGVAADAAVTEASVGAFPVPAELSTVDKSVIPGTGLTVEVGREPRQLADWSSYMGNCIGTTWYADDAREGQCVLMALRDGHGRIAANLDIRKRAGGWWINEIRARFNDELDKDRTRAIERWVAGLAPPETPAAAPASTLPPVRVRTRGPARRPAAVRLPSALIEELTARVERELRATRADSARRVYVHLARGLGQPGRPADHEPDAAVTALRRLGPERHAELVRTALDAGLDALTLWRATGVRPLATAVGTIDPEVRERHRLGPLTEDASLPRTLRALVRRPEITPARTMDVVARTVRAAVGDLVRADDTALIESVTRRPSPELVCALAITVTCADQSTVDNLVRVVPATSTEVPGFPATDLLDENGPWQRARAAAIELGAPVELSAERGLLVPARLLGNGGWPALWSRAHR